MNPQEISDLTAVAQSVPQWCHVLTGKARELGWATTDTKRGEALTSQERYVIGQMYGYLATAIDVFSEHVRTTERILGHSLPEDWNVEEIK
jgi:hypothetical protein